MALQVGYEFANVKVAKKLLKKKNEYIAALRKQLKLPSSEHPQDKEIIQGHKEKDDMMNLIF